MSIENTSQRDPIVHLTGALGGTDEYITGMEAAGQRQLVASTKLPAKASGFNTSYGEDGWAEFEALGFRKGEPVEGDPLFVEATLPEGWSKQAGHGSMGSYVVDERGVRRVSVFYKAAFYDRRADMHLINVGWNLATEVLYGDGTAALPEQWDVLDAVERAEFERALEHAIQDSKEHPTIYREQGIRAKTVMDLIAKAAKR